MIPLFFPSFLAASCSMWESYFPNKGLNLCPLQWKCGGSTPVLRGKSLHDPSWLTYQTPPYTLGSLLVEIWGGSVVPPPPSQKSFLSLLLVHHPPPPNKQNSSTLLCPGSISKLPEPHRFQGWLASIQIPKHKIALPLISMASPGVEFQLVATTDAWRQKRKDPPWHIWTPVQALITGQNLPISCPSQTTGAGPAQEPWASAFRMQLTAFWGYSPLCLSFLGSGNPVRKEKLLILF